MSVDRIGRVQGKDLELFLKTFMSWTDGTYSVQILVQEDGVKFRVGDAGAWSRPWGDVSTRYSEGETAPYTVEHEGTQKAIGTFGCRCDNGYTESDFAGLCGMCGGRYMVMLTKEGVRE